MLLLLASSVFAGVLNRYGVQYITDYDARIQYNKMDLRASLTPVIQPEFVRGSPPYFPRGIARIQSVRSSYKPMGQVLITTKEIQPSYIENSVYVAWLRDDETGYMLNVGSFEAAGGGVGVLNYHSTLYFDAYDTVVITKEPRNDDNPLPGETILIGAITKRAIYEPAPPARKAAYGETIHNE